MLEIIVGSQRNPHVRDILETTLEGAELDGTLYIGYPILASAEGTVSVDALLCTKQHGLTVLDFQPFADLHEVARRQDQLHAAVFQKLYTNPALRRGRQGLLIDMQVVTVSPDVPRVIHEGEAVISPAEQLLDVVTRGGPVADDLLKVVNASIERISTLKPQGKRPNVTRDNSRGAIIARIEKEIANLDRWQKRAAIETPDGPQRIRGLAGSGKTIVLALKAAYLHAQNPDWHIALTFHTRSLYQQLRDLVVRFSYEAMNDEPNWDRLRILHSWGSASQPGMYSTLAAYANRSARDFNYARAHYGYGSAFDGVCQELLTAFREANVPPLFDFVLIDEAQDLPKAFFQLCYAATAAPHRVIWAYDEMQNLTQESMPPLRELFGADEHGRPRLERLRTNGSPRQDVILPVCYRNPPWNLSVAHALGFGIYRRGGLIQFFDDPALWEEIGYEVVSGEIAPGQEVTLRRSERSYPPYFPELLRPDDAVQTFLFKSAEEQASWLADSIVENLRTDELRAPDVLVILCNPLEQKRDAAAVMEALAARGLSTHLAGITSSVDALFRDESIALSGIFRAKGNEAPMVYVLHSEYGAASGLELIRRRNVLFTAITRSRAWVRICGIGPAMRELSREVQAVVENEYMLNFRVPTPRELERMRRIHRDMPAAERTRISRTQKEFRDLLKRIEDGELPPEVLSADLRRRLERILRGEEP